MNGRLSRDPLAHLTIKNVRCENPRRALSVDEIACLLDYVNTAPAIWNVPGHERALIYVVLNGKWTLETRDLEMYTEHPNFQESVHDNEALQ